MYRLVFQSPNASRPPITGDAGTLVIGREAGCGLQLTEAGVRDRHAAIERRADGYYLRDLIGSRTVRINDKAVSDQRLKSGDALEIGAIRLDFQVLQEAAGGRRAFDSWQALAGVIVVVLVAGQIGFFGWIFSQPHPRNMKLDIVKGKQAKPPAPADPVNSPPPPLVPLVPVTPPPTTVPPAAPVALSRLLKIARVDRVDGAVDVTLRIQIKAQVGERQLDPANVSVNVQCFSTTTKTPATQNLTAPAVWENFTSKQLLAHFNIPPAQCAGYVVRTYYRKQLQDVLAMPAGLAAAAP